MKIAILNTSDLSGGAAVACSRLVSALSKSNHDVTYLVRDKTEHYSLSSSINNTLLKRRLAYLRLATEKGILYNKLKNKKDLFRFSLPYFGENIFSHPSLLDADIIHLHWINKSFVSLQHIRKLISLNKPIVWTLHDMWAFTGGCHYSGHCTNYTSGCGQCYFLNKPHISDLSAQVTSKKLKAGFSNINYITCSNWLHSLAKNSILLNSSNIQAIPNPINTTQFRPIDNDEIRLRLGIDKDAFVVLFASMDVNDIRKGYAYLQKALLNLSTQKSTQKIEVLIFGRASEDLLENIPFKYHYLGSLNRSEDIIDAYNAASVFVIPSLQDNLPNTVMEAMSCGLPVVGFDVGGIPEMVVDGHTGYIATTGDAQSLSKSIQLLIDQPERCVELGKNARNKVELDYAESIVAKKYLEFYKSII